MDPEFTKATINKFSTTIFQYIDGFETQEGQIIDGTLDELIENMDNNFIAEQVISGETSNEITSNMIDDYIEVHFNSNQITNFYDWINQLSDDGDLEDLYSSKEFIVLLSLCAKWFLDEFTIYIKLNNDKELWNTIAYWFVKNNCYEIIHKRLKSYIDEIVYDEIERRKIKDIYKGESRLECVVCFEKKVIYTGCSKCHSAFCCFECYDKLDNVCPLCRYDQMISCCKCNTAKKAKENPEKYLWYGKLTRVVQQINQPMLQVQEEPGELDNIE